MTRSSNRRLELLAPAGDWDALRAAVANGADAVYFGLPKFNARFRATNFQADELPHVMTYLHERNVRGYVAFNTLIFSDELPSVVECLQAIADAGVDALIVQDLGLARLIRALVPTLPIHGSTQMTLTEPLGIEFVREKLGIGRVILARELSAREIAAVASATDVELEVFVHGALCVAYSGQCLTSEALGGRSANRGQCAQACRLPYDLFVDGKHRDLGDRAYLLSPQDLAAYDLIEPLAANGVVSFKIEGRLKSAHYVAETTQVYRAAIDRQAEFRLSEAEKRDLEQCFSRGLSHGFLDGVDHQALVQARFPKSRGVRAGTVKQTGQGGVIVELMDDGILKPGDGVVFDLGRPEENEPGGRVYEIVPLGHRVARLMFRRESLDFSQLVAGTRVWKTDDPALRQRLEHSFASSDPYRRVIVNAAIGGALGGPLEVKFIDPEGRVATAVWPGPLETARKHPLTEAVAREQLGRLGDTPFQLGDLSMNMAGELLVPKSVLNDLRRKLVNDLMRERSEALRHRVVEGKSLESLRPQSVSPDSITASRELVVHCRTLDQLDAALATRPAAVYCDFEDLRRYREAVDRARTAAVPIGLATLRIQKPGEEGHLRLVAGFSPDFLLIRNLAGLALCRRDFPEIPLVGDFSLNVANELTAELLMQSGLARLVPSYDLNWEQLSALVRRSDPGWYEVVIHQHMPMFHMEHCVFAAFLSEGKDWRDCGRPCDHHRVELRDRVGADFPVLADIGCRNTVFNSVPQSAAEFLPRMLALGLRRFRIELLRERPDQVAPLVERYRAILDGRDNGQSTWRQLQALNQLGVTRGTLQLL